MSSSSETAVDLACEAGKKLFASVPCREEIDLIIFNLGYLPKGDHSITTQADTTIEGVDQSIGLIKKHGMVVVVVYHGHSEGKREKDAIEEYIGDLDQKKYNVVKFSFANQINTPPYVIAIEKI